VSLGLSSVYPSFSVDGTKRNLRSGVNEYCNRLRKRGEITNNDVYATSVIATGIQADLAVNLIVLTEHCYGFSTI
jgi:hypothetical protein